MRIKCPPKPQAVATSTTEHDRCFRAGLSAREENVARVRDCVRKAQEHGKSDTAIKKDAFRFTNAFDQPVNKSETVESVLNVCTPRGMNVQRPDDEMRR